MNAETQIEFMRFEIEMVQVSARSIKSDVNVATGFNKAISFLKTSSARLVCTTVTTRQLVGRRCKSHSVSLSMTAPNLLRCYKFWMVF